MKSVRPMTELDMERCNWRSEKLYLSPEGSISFVKVITAYSENCSLQNADMHGHELFLAMDENREWKLNFSQTDNVSKPCSQDWMSVWLYEWTYSWMFCRSSVQVFRRSVEQRFRRSSVQLFRRSVVQTFSCSDVQTDYRSINRITDNSNIQSYEWKVVQMTAHELLLAMDDNLNQIINFFANGYVSLTNAHQANSASKSNTWWDQMSRIFGVWYSGSEILGYIELKAIIFATSFQSHILRPTRDGDEPVCR